MRQQSGERRRQRQRQQGGIQFLVSVFSLLVCYALNVVVADENVICAKGWGAGPGASKKTVIIPPEWINDGYCDCPLDGLDEPNTNACSGSKIGGWPGVAVAEKDSFTYQCPEQPKKKIPLSRMDDGICDCCDGSDESNDMCWDVCNEVMAAERAERAKIEKEFKVGYDKRKKETMKFDNLVKITHRKMNEIHEQLSETNASLSAVSEQIKAWKVEFLTQRLDRVKEIVTNNALIKGLLEPLSNEELVNLMIHTCQMAGEMEEQMTSDSEKTCAPLRMAGLDASIMWEEENLKTGDWVQLSRWESTEPIRFFMLSQLVHWNLNVDDDKIWNRKDFAKHHGNKKKDRRRLEEVDEEEMDDDYAHYDDDDYHRHMGDDDYVMDEEGHDDDEDDYDYDYSRHRRNRNNNRNKKKKVEPTGKEKELLDVIEGTLFSKSRAAFLQHSKAIVQRVEDLLSEDDDDDDDNKDGEGDEKDDDSTSESEASEQEQNIDPVAFQMVRNTLEKRISLVQRGMNYAVSAKLLLTSVVEAKINDIEEDGDIVTPESIRKDLIALAAGTLFHSQISTSHLWQILSVIVPELTDDDASSEEEQQQQQTCSLPGQDWQITSCPPRTIDRSSVSYPPKAFVDSVQNECNNYDASSSPPPEATCESPDDENNNISIPASITDNYHGYSELKPRNLESDILSQAFSNWDVAVDEKSMQDLENLETESNKLKQKTEDLEKEMNDLTEEIGGADSDNSGDNKFGLNGELHAMKDDCFDIQANKYIYEVCLFKKASQKDRDKPKAHGTDLGKWTGMEFTNKNIDGEPTEHQRILKWENGQSCWNGPRRSVTAYVTCGAETKLLSAEEPDTCRYVMKMQSHIACDDIFKDMHGL